MKSNVFYFKTHLVQRNKRCRVGYNRRPVNVILCFEVLSVHVHRVCPQNVEVLNVNVVVH